MAGSFTVFNKCSSDKLAQQKYFADAVSIYGDIVLVSVLYINEHKRFSLQSCFFFASFIVFNLTESRTSHHPPAMPMCSCFHEP